MNQPLLLMVTCGWAVDLFVIMFVSLSFFFIIRVLVSKYEVYEVRSIPLYSMEEFLNNLAKTITCTIIKRTQ